MKHLFFFLTLFAFSLSSSAQTPCFDADDTVGCAPFFVTMINCSEDFNPRYRFVETDTFPLPGDTHTYFTQGVYSITQIINNQSGGGGIKTLTKENYITVLGAPTPQFEAKPCEGRELVISITGDNYDIYEVDFGDGSAIDSLLPNESSTYTYADTLPKTVTVRGKYLEATCGSSATKDVTLFNELIKPDITQTLTSSDSEIELSFNAFDFLTYSNAVSVNSGAFLTLDTFSVVGADSTLLFNGLDVNDDNCFRLTSFDVCGNSIVSDTICHTFLVVAKAENNQTILNWNSYANPQDVLQYKIFRNSTPLDSIFPQNLQIDSTGRARYVDTEVICGQEYCYQIVTELKQLNKSGTSLLSASNTICVTAISEDTPDPVEDFLASVENDSILLSWEIPDPFVPATYFLGRQVDTLMADSLYRSFASTNQQYIDSSATPSNAPYCYFMDFVDVCGNLSDTSETPLTCSMLLQGKESLTEGYILEWTPFIGFEGNTSYILEWLDASGTAFKSVNVGNTLSFTDTELDAERQVLYYRVIAQSDLNEGQSFSNIIRYKQPATLFFPNAFTPDGNGANDLFFPKGKFIDTYELHIFNQWGEEVFESDAMDDGWNGFYREKLSASGTYTFRAKAVDKTGEEVIRSGTFVLIR